MDFGDLLYGNSREYFVASLCTEQANVFSSRLTHVFPDGLELELVDSKWLLP